MYVFFVDRRCMMPLCNGNASRFDISFHVSMNKFFENKDFRCPIFQSAWLSCDIKVIRVFSQRMEEYDVPFYFIRSIVEHNRLPGKFRWDMDFQN